MPRLKSLPTPAPLSPEQEVDRYRAPALDKGLDILELLAGQPQGLTRAEIVKAMGRGPSEIYRMLERLVARHYVSRSPEGDRYALSLKLFVLGSLHPPLERLIARAQPLLESFARAVQQSCHLGVYDRGNVSVVAQASSPGSWGLSIRPGVQVSLIDTGSGHVLLAFQTAERRTRMLAEHQALEGETPMGQRALETVLRQVRKQRAWRGASQQAAGVTDLSVPILGPQGDALAVLTCPYIRRLDRRTGPGVEATLQRLREAADGLAIA